MSDTNTPVVGLVVPVGRPGNIVFRGEHDVADALKKLAREAFDAREDMDIRDTPAEAFEIWWNARSK